MQAPPRRLVRHRVTTVCGALLSAAGLLGAVPSGARAATDPIEPRPTAASAAPAPEAAHAASARIADAALAWASTTRLSPAAYQSRMVATLASTATASRYLGRYLSAVVVDRATGQVLWSTNAGASRLPASTQKLVTAFTVLHSMDPTDRLVTSVTLEQPGSRTLFLRGRGDPSLSRARLRLLAADTAARMRALGQSTARLHIDDSLLPSASLAPGWKPSYLNGEVQYVRGLTLGGYRGPDGAAAAGKVFAGYLTGYGVTTRFVGRSLTPGPGIRLTATSSATISALVAQMLSVSDNDYAEYLARHAALAKGRPATFAGAAAHQRAVLAAAGIPVAGYVVHDGSGLSRADRMPVATLSGVLGRLLTDRSDRDIVFAYGSIPRAGQTGTLRSRFATSYQACARGRVMAKTGTLSGVVGLAGLAKGSDGRDRIFVLLNNGRPETGAVRSSLDTLATIVVGCRLG